MSAGPQRRIEGVLQHLPALARLLAAGLVQDMRGDVGEVSQGEVDRGHEIERVAVMRDGRRLQAELQNLTHRNLTHYASHKTGRRIVLPSLVRNRSGTG